MYLDCEEKHHDNEKANEFSHLDFEIFVIVFSSCIEP